MQWQLLFLSIPPIVAYVAFSARGKSRSGMTAAVVVSVLELAYNSLELGFLEFGILELGSLEVGSLEFGMLEVGFLEVGSRKVDISELGFQIFND